MPRPKVLLIGATGNAGGSILEALLAAERFDVEILIRPSSASKPAVQALTQKRGIPQRIVDIDLPSDELVPALANVDILICSLGPGPVSVTQQKGLVRAAKKAGVRRFVPSSWITIAPPHGAMLLTEETEEIYHEILLHSLGYTIIDVGYWYQTSFPPLPSGRTDYAIPLKETRTIHGDGTAPNILTEIGDIGRFVARIIADERTLNRRVYTCGEVLTENEIFAVVEEMAGERVERVFEPPEETQRKATLALEELAKDPHDIRKLIPVWLEQYRYSKYVRQDNRPEYAEYLGYLDARQLYPDLRPTSFREYFAEVLAGRARNPYA
ncbi:NAD(P)-binding protein [Aspergillus homomorphus CBS 101889]|uniref:NAD(P)-binding protein n=1 Tax=Aspergillus homomorphus (strain CBS 101889) TaxID=1450537 RepID=A0A395HYX4_ASPHC|nr:NAD(P)-binding protein [Aspergillus homomorphus CBS 101889]RAL12719.1 NAD(P)-binding protein [Aspergillus homomorphus CBS 101889]